MSDSQIRVLVASTDGDFCDFVEARESDTIGAFKENLMKLPSFSYDASPNDIKLMSQDGSELCTKKTLQEYQMNDQSCISMSVNTSITRPSGKYMPPNWVPDNEYDAEPKEIQIYIAFLGQRTGFDISLENSITIKDLKIKIMNKIKPLFMPKNQRIFLNGSNLQEDKTLAYYNIDTGTNLFVYLNDGKLISPADGQVLLHVSHDGKILTITIESKDVTIKQVKKLVWEKTGILPAFQRLNFNGENLDRPDQVLSGYGIETESFLYLYQRGERDAEPGYSTLPANMNPDVVERTSGGSGHDSNDNMVTIILMDPAAGGLDSGIPFELNKDAPLRQIFNSYSEQFGIPASSLQFLHDIYGELPHDCELSPEAMGLDNGCTLMVVPNIENQESVAPLSVSSNDHDSNMIDLTPFGDSGSTITLTIQNIDNQCVSAKITKETTSLQLLFDCFADKVGISGDLLMYKVKGKSYYHNVDKTALECGIENDDTITAVLRVDEEDRIKSEKEENARAVLTKFVSRVRQRRELAKQRRERAHKTIADLVWKSAALKRRQRLRKSVVQIQKAVRGYNASAKWHRLRGSAILAETIARGYLARKHYSDAVRARILEFRHFSSVWRPIADLAAAQRASARLHSLFGWAIVRENINLKKTEDIDEDGNLVDTNEKLNKALAGALSETNEDESTDETESESDLENEMPKDTTNHIRDTTIDWSQFQVTHHVCKFLRNGDARFKAIFVKKIKQLGRGERSHKLQKPLQGCNSVIYETYLENKSGWRILWTQEGNGIVIWFVCQHKSVSRFAKLIDDAKNRTARQQLPESFVSLLENGSSQHETKMDVKLDPIGNVPLKVYDIENVDDIVTDDWAPRMHLTREERDVVEAKGTVLLLGRSGTGKTVCISNRIEFDRERLGHKADFSQLFVSRSKQLCRYVKDAVGESKGSTFTTFEKLVSEIQASLSQFIGRSFQRNQNVGFARFNNEFYSPRYSQEDCGALIAWKAIRTFLKGSIEAYQQTNRVLSQGHFVGEQLGKNRCQVPMHLRKSIYSIFLQYQKWLNEQHLHDDCDRISSLLKAIEDARKSHSQVFEEKVKKTRIYVDEVQDYTQVEILLFFYISGGPGALFLAGDPAQSVVEGTDFRFEEIRSVGYFVAGDARRHLIPEKPKVVNVNFRSHSGILNTAASVLDFLFMHFPSSVKQLPKDHGLFKGSRPSVFRDIQIETLSTLLKEKMPGAVVLTHDETAAQWKERLDHVLVYGIREAKGMEFKSVIILDFFAELPSSLQKPCRDLLLNRYDEHDRFQEQFPLVEVHLKLLYTAITRCIEQLFFAETTDSLSGVAAVRWLTATSTVNNSCSDGANEEALATINKNVKDLEAMTMTNDEFCIVGIDNAEQAEANADLSLETSLGHLDKAIYCFKKAQRSELVVKATVHAKCLKLKDKLTKPIQSQDMGSIEIDVSRTIASLLHEDLFAESLSLINTLMPLVTPYKQKKLEEYVIGHIDVLNE